MLERRFHASAFTLKLLIKHSTRQVSFVTYALVAASVSSTLTHYSAGHMLTSATWLSLQNLLQGEFGRVARSAAWTSLGHLNTCGFSTSNNATLTRLILKFLLHWKWKNFLKLTVRHRGLSETLWSSVQLGILKEYFQQHQLHGLILMPSLPVTQCC